MNQIMADFADAVNSNASPYEQLITKADALAYLAILNGKWELVKRKTYKEPSGDLYDPRQPVVNYHFGPINNDQLRLLVAYRLNMASLVFRFIANKQIFVLDTKLIGNPLQTLEPSHITSKLRQFNGHNLIIRTYEDCYHNNRIASAILDKLVTALDKTLDQTMIRVISLGGPYHSIELKPFIANESIVVARLEESRIITYELPIRAKHYHTLDLANPSVDPEVAVLEIAERVKLQLCDWSNI